ncbi:MAG: carbon monoxide dehydrogenase subunit G, partial [Pseudomonadota bacterium]
MKMSDSRVIKAEPEIVWAALLDPEVLKACVPGCQEMTGSPEDGFEATVVQKVGPVKATFKGVVQLKDMDRPKSLTIEGEGKGGAAGFAKGGADVTLSAQDDGTLLSYELGQLAADLGLDLVR